jgi:hypothetical protein
MQKFNIIFQLMVREHIKKKESLNSNDERKSYSSSHFLLLE